MTSKSEMKRECGPTHSRACQCREEYFAKVEAKLKLAEGALELYADPNNYDRVHTVRIGVNNECGERARTALAELRKA